MKPAVLKILTITFLSVCTISSCKKGDTGDNSTPKSKTTLLTQSSWKVQAVALDANKDGVSDGDATSLVQACKLDNIYTFKTDGSGMADEGSAKCNSTDPQTSPFTWLFKSNETILSGTLILFNGDATIISINDTNLVITYDDSSTGYRIIVTFKH